MPRSWYQAAARLSPGLATSFLIRPSHHAARRHVAERCAKPPPTNQPLPLSHSPAQTKRIHATAGDVIAAFVYVLVLNRPEEATACLRAQRKLGEKVRSDQVVRPVHIPPPKGSRQQLT